MKEAFEKIRKRIEDITEPIRPVGWSRKIEVVETKAVMGILSEVEAEYGNGWIDVKDRLPEKDGYYLTCDHKGNIHVFFHHQGLKETAPFGICEHHSQYYQPIAWMELPKPYNRLERK